MTLLEVKLRGADDENADAPPAGAGCRSQMPRRVSVRQARSGRQEVGQAGLIFLVPFLPPKGRAEAFPRRGGRVVREWLRASRRYVPRRAAKKARTRDGRGIVSGNRAGKGIVTPNKPRAERGKGQLNDVSAFFF